MVAGYILDILCMHACMHVCMYVYIYLHIDVYIYNIYTRIYTYSNIGGIMWYDMVGICWYIDMA